MRPLLILILVLAALAAPSHAFTAQNGMHVEATGPQAFTVRFPSPDAETQYLCAAGDFVMRGLGLPGVTRIYRASPPPRKQGQGITFTLDEAQKVKMALFTSLGAKDNDGGISAAVARGSYCTILRIWPE